MEIWKYEFNINVMLKVIEMNEKNELNVYIWNTQKRVKGNREE